MYIAEHKQRKEKLRESLKKFSYFFKTVTHLFSFIEEHDINLAKQKLERCKKGIEDQYEFKFIKKDGDESKFFYPA